MGIADIADDLVRGVEDAAARTHEALFEPVLRLGVTGLSRAGKTVFITSLVANMLNRGRMPQLLAAGSGAIRAAWLQPQPDDTVPRFDYENHLAALTGSDPHWPTSTRSISQLRLSMRVQPAGFFGSIAGLRSVHLDIVDYPGEWLLDLGLLDRSYADWSAQVLERMAARQKLRDLGAGAFLDAARELHGKEGFDEADARTLARLYTSVLGRARAEGFSDGAPGRFLLPGELDGSPVLTFAPLPRPAHPLRRGLWREMERRFRAYRSLVVKPFFRDHFARIDRQIVLIDVLGAIHAGPPAVEDLRLVMADVLRAFRPGRNSWLSRLTGKRVERILFAATKADHLHHRQHPRLTAITEALVADARNRADFAGATTGAMSIASLRATVEETLTHEGRRLDCVRGRLLDSGKVVALYPGELPLDPALVLNPARQGQPRWLNGDYGIMQFAPARTELRPGEGPAHIRLDKAAEFLIGDRLR